MTGGITVFLALPLLCFIRLSFTTGGRIYSMGVVVFAIGNGLNSRRYSRPYPSFITPCTIRASYFICFITILVVTNGGTIAADAFISGGSPSLV